MPLFASNSPTYYDQKDQYIRSFMEDFYYQVSPLNQAQWAEGDTDARFYAGDQSAWNDYYGNVTLNQRKTYNFNHIRPLVNLVDGQHSRNRKSLIARPMENADNVTADLFTKSMMWAAQLDNLGDTFCDAARGSLITGLNLINVYIDYSRDPVNGDIRFDRCANNQVLIDPFFRKKDLSDCRAIWKRSFVTKREASVLVPEDRRSDVLALPSLDQRDGKFNFMPENFNYNMKNLVTYDEFYYKDYREGLFLFNERGYGKEWYGSDDDLRVYLAYNPNLYVQKNTIPTTRLALVVQGKVFYDGPQPLGIDEMPFCPVLCYYMPDLAYYPWRMQGLVRGLRDAQYLYNRRKVIELDIVESVVNSGYFAKENSVVNPKDLYKTGQGQVIWLKKDAQMTDVQQIPTSNPSPALFQISETLEREMQKVIGVNEEMIGSSAEDVAGLISMMRRDGGYMSLQSIFDNFDSAFKHLGTILLKAIQNNWTPGKIQRITGEEPTPEFYDKTFGQYDVAIEQGLNTTTQQQLQFAQMLQLKQIGLPLSEIDILEASTLQGKQKIIDNMMQQMQAQQMQAQQQEQMQAQLAMQDQQAKMQMASARANADNAMANERNSRIQENQALAQERLAEAEKDKEQAILNMVKSLHEIDSMSLTGLQQAINIVNMIKSQTNPPQPSGLQ